MGVSTRASESAPGEAATGAPVGIASFPPVLATNAYQRLLYEHLADWGITLVQTERLRLGWLRRMRHEVGILHFHWIQPYYAYAGRPTRLRPLFGVARLALFAGRLAAARRLGYRIVWTIHQTRPHDSETPRLDRVASLTLARAAHVLVAHDRPTADDAERHLHPSRPVEVVPHGSYLGAYPEGRRRDAVREELDIPSGAFAFLAFGLVRRYKDLDVLLDAFAALPDPDTVLVVAGMAVDVEVVEAIAAAAAADGRIRPLLGFVSDERVAELYGACDAAVLTRGDGGTSGALILALSLGCPVVAAATETYAELVGNGEAGWLFEPGSAESLSAALAEATADRAAAREKGAAARRRAEGFRWPDIAEQLASLMRR